MLSSLVFNLLNLRPVGSFFVTRVACHHAIFIQVVKIPFFSLSSTPGSHNILFPWSHPLYGVTRFANAARTLVH
jgi:hypothetical protein